MSAPAFCSVGPEVPASFMSCQRGFVEMSSKQIRVLLIDHQTLLRESLGAMLGAERDLVVAGHATGAEEALDLVARVQPDVVLFDADRPERLMDAFVRLRAACGSRFLVLSSHDHPALLQELLAMGVSGYLAKTVTLLELVTAIRTVAVRDGCVVLSVSRASIERLGRAEDDAGLSRREKEILRRISDGLSNGQIARRLSISEGTVKRHVHSIFIKLGAVSRIDAVNKYSELREGRGELYESVS
ncbi:LuxR C-terminal-related transcriptional regulator [Streptomyces boncukensis]|uniref:Response regulator transcription factor n=1 Tax=Streptomyces boncukensis TaxID=2711219 RepID=A0A6G4WSK4_9ACTN|nr:response regulator transcription factor [Streptomyces boncukensis]NGO67607.1 response regulator transcription factor [Streptomyces boncukensis]